MPVKVLPIFHLMCKSVCDMLVNMLADNILAGWSVKILANAPWLASQYSSCSAGVPRPLTIGTTLSPAGILAKVTSKTPHPVTIISSTAATRCQAKAKKSIYYISINFTLYSKLLQSHTSNSHSIYRAPSKILPSLSPSSLLQSLGCTHAVDRLQRLHLQSTQIISHQQQKIPPE